ncbi:MAG TPA: formyltransferase family protein [bacterium]|nr:formyltransferase family protein [bacterium]HOL48575.1 formyltransferase family protein [bacterium]HPQ20140.1 formyltransferase family protein [bacterium]
MKTKLNYGFIGCIEFSKDCLETLIQNNIKPKKVFIGNKNFRKINSDYCDYSYLCKKNKIDYMYFSYINDPKIKNEIIKKKLDVVFVLGLSQIINEEILKCAKIGFIGSHPTLLPLNRGHHPIIWAIANGLKWTGITLFWLDKGIDTGYIFKQKKILIKKRYTAKDLLLEVTKITKELLLKGIQELEAGKITKIKQPLTSNYWRKRTFKDGVIDWRMSAERIINLIRALYEPYPNAVFEYKNNYYKIKEAKIIKTKKYIDNIEPGKIIKVFNDKSFIVKTGDKLIKIIKHTLIDLPKEGEYLI